MSLAHTVGGWWGRPHITTEHFTKGPTIADLRVRSRGNARITEQTTDGTSGAVVDFPSMLRTWALVNSFLFTVFLPAHSFYSGGSDAVVGRRNRFRIRCSRIGCSASSADTTMEASHTLTESELVALAREFLATGTGFYSGLRPELFDEDFVFRGGVVGPLNKDDYLRTMSLLGVAESFALNANAFGFTVDPAVPNSVRFFLRDTGEHVKPWQPWGAFPPLPLSPRPGKTSVVAPTETARLIFSDAGKVKHFARGLVVGKYENANTNGLGAVLGLFNAIGVGQVGALALNQQVRDFSNLAADQFPSLEIPKTRTTGEKVPSWWKE